MKMNESNENYSQDSNNDNNLNNSNETIINTDIPLHINKKIERLRIKLINKINKISEIFNNQINIINTELQKLSYKYNELNGLFLLLKKKRLIVKMI